ncbi:MULTISPECIES: hypothetical protein [Oxalobacteraceae]|jgi:hypothetical protein|uniref:hypothetical protein n=1 Tax=Oxalobacteraceae TaxID=75682 RepID=UPI0010A415D4|nr:MULTISPECIES: hypothetical protein [Oxalobacteraceae]
MNRHVLRTRFVTIATLRMSSDSSHSGRIHISTKFIKSPLSTLSPARRFAKAHGKRRVAFSLTNQGCFFCMESNLFTEVSQFIQKYEREICHEPVSKSMGGPEDFFR